MKKFFTLLCMALVSAAGFAQDSYDPTAHTAFVSGTDNLCSGYWSSEDAMTYDANDGVWKITLSAKDTQAIEFKVVYDGSWYGKEGGEANYKFQVEEPSDVLITFDPQTMLATYSGDKVKEWNPNAVTINFIVAAGSSGLLNGLDWKIGEEEAAANKMTEEDTGYYTLELKGVAAGNYEFKFVANGSWSEVQWGAFEGEGALTNNVAKSATTDNGKNFTISLEKGSLYDVTLTLDIMNPAEPMVTAAWVSAGEAPVEPDVYSLAGTFNSWNKDDVTTEMTNVSEGVYSTVISLPQGHHEFKVVTNHDWAVAYPADNYVLNLSKDADVTITLNLANAETPVTVDSTECSVYFVTINVETTKESVNIYACQGESWENLTGSWPGAAMNGTDDGFTYDVKVTKGQTLQIIFNGEPVEGKSQTENIMAGTITKNCVLNYILNNDWSFNEGTGIQSVEAAAKQNGAIYTIAGQRVEKAVRGLYIINGKKVVVK